MLTPPNTPSIASSGWLDTESPHGQAWAPLAVLRSSDLDETREHIARIYKPHDLTVLGKHQRVRARMHHRALGPSVSLNRLAHGASVRIDPDKLDDFFLVQMPLAGKAQVWHQNTQHTCTAGQASVLSPSEGVRMEWSDGCDQFMLRIDKQRLGHVAQALTGRNEASAREIRLTPRLDLMSGRGAHWWQLMQYLARLMQPSSNGPTSGVHTAMLEDHVLASLLQAAWPLAGQLSETATHATPPKLRQLEDFIQSHLDQPLTVSDLARSVRSSVRLVQQLFARERGTTPGAYMRAQRLQRVRHDLLHPLPDTRVSQTAAHWGFEHQGRFAAAYQQAFGESPCTTLARSRG